MPPALRIRPYKDFLTPLLHRRFMRAAAILILVCYLEALLIAPWNGWFWSWFPLGIAGIHTGLLFICAFSIFVLRVGQLHVGLRTTNSPFDTFTQYAFRWQSIQTWGWYGFTAWIYYEVYIYSSPKSANIYRFTDSQNSELPKLNERSIYLFNYFQMLAIVQTIFHLYYDYDRIDIPIAKTNSEPEPPYLQLKSKLSGLAISAAKRSFTMTVAGPVIYSMTIRQIAWSFCRSFAKIFWRLPRSSSLPVIGPFHWFLLWRTLTGGFLIVFMWEVGNAAFSTYVGQQPLKNDRPITYESRDPNGSLLTGLRGKKLQTQAFALWELLYIAQRYQGRRKTIFEEIDRKGGSTWFQVLDICLGTINSINTRINNHLSPPPPAGAAAKVVQDIPTLPRLSGPIKNENIFTASPPPRTTTASIEAAISSYAKAHGNSVDGPQTVKLIGHAKSKILTPDQQKAISSEGIWSKVHIYARQAVESPLGWPFRQDYRRRIAVIVLGVPYGDAGIIVDAVESLTQLSVCSLTEDPFGNVSRDVPEIIRTFTAVVANLEEIKQNLGLHWTDVEKKKESPEVDTILVALKKGLNELLEAFGDYSVDLRLSQSDMRMAREAATPPRVEEMKQK